MPDFDDQIEGAISDFLEETGKDCVYIRGSSTATVNLRKSKMPPVLIDDGTGHIVEVVPVAFIGLTRELPFDPPIDGDRIKVGGETFEVLPTISEKCFRRISDPMTRIHCKKVA